MKINLALHSQRLRTDYLRDNYLHLPKLISAEQALIYLKQTEALPSKRVVCGLEDVSWDEQSVPPDQYLFKFFASKQMVDLMRMVLEMDVINDPQINCWISRYKTGEYINPHKDKAGTIQTILCLCAIDKKNGGSLMLKTGKERIFVSLQAGDAVVFKANVIEHSTTPLVSSQNCPHPSRVVAVSRYTFL